MKNLLLSLFLLIGTLSLANAENIVIDGYFDDWENIPVADLDTVGDSGGNDIDLRTMKLASNSQFFYIYFETTSEINIQENNNLTLYIDMDNNPSTGTSINGIGADLEWVFGSRSGDYHSFYFNESYAITPYQPGNKWNSRVVTGPTVTSSRFEVALLTYQDWSVKKPNKYKYTFKVLLQESGGDSQPDSGSTVGHIINSEDDPASPNIPLEKENLDSVRVVSYNTLFGGLFESEREDSFFRIFQAISPDVFCFQEIYNETANEVVNLIESILPSSPGENWYGTKNYDTIVVSRFPVLDETSVDANLGVILNLPDDKYDRDLAIINAHLPCCSFNNVSRQKEIDNILSLIREGKNQSGSLPLPFETPFMVLGDLNLVDQSQHLTSLLTGDIIYEVTYGNDFTPDWDGTPLTDLNPIHSHKNKAYTWWDDGSSYGSGKLDFIIYSDSVIQEVKSYVLRTEEMFSSDLTQNNLQSDETATASDHLPLVFDFIFKVPQFQSWILY